MSLMRSSRHSVRRKPLPYNSPTMSHIAPLSRRSTAATSSRVSTTGNTTGRRARTIPFSTPTSCFKTSRYKNSTALSAWF